MKVLDLFCGLGGWSKAFHDAGHECTGIDIKNIGYHGKFIQADLNDWEPNEDYDIILASPPCTEFSIAKKISNSQEDERQGLDLVYRAFYLISIIKPKYFILENVKGLGEFLPPPTDIIRYGRNKSHKEAWIWSNIGKLGMLESMIHYRLMDFSGGDPRRSLIPYPLSKAVLKKIKEKEREAERKRKE
jgi:site-specific DNA-cytosine methylase